jgi:hypothetical protein
VKKLQDSKVRERYKDALKSKLDVHEAVNGDDIIGLWNSTKDKMIIAATEVRGVVVRKNGKVNETPWWGAEVKEAVNEKKKAWLDILAIGSSQEIVRTDENEKKERA